MDDLLSSKTGFDAVVRERSAGGDERVVTPEPAVGIERWTRPGQTSSDGAGRNL